MLSKSAKLAALESEEDSELDDSDEKPDDSDEDGLFKGSIQYRGKVMSNVSGHKKCLTKSTPFWNPPWPESQKAMPWCDSWQYTRFDSSLMPALPDEYIDPMYPDDGAGPDETGITFNKQMAALLSARLDHYADVCVIDREAKWVPAYDVTGDELPRAIRPYYGDSEWRRSFQACFERLRDRLYHGFMPMPNCIGEEVALYIVLDWIKNTGTIDSDHWSYYADALQIEYDGVCDGIPDGHEDTFTELYDQLVEMMESRNFIEREDFEIRDSWTSLFFRGIGYSPFDWFFPFDKKQGASYGKSCKVTAKSKSSSQHLRTKMAKKATSKKPALKTTPAPITKKKPKVQLEAVGKKACGYCGQPGHNRRTCHERFTTGSDGAVRTTTVRRKGL
jgi:hypothetical protein